MSTGFSGGSWFKVLSFSQSEKCRRPHPSQHHQKLLPFFPPYMVCVCFPLNGLNERMWAHYTPAVHLFSLWLLIWKWSSWSLEPQIKLKGSEHLGAILVTSGWIFVYITIPETKGSSQPNWGSVIRGDWGVSYTNTSGRLSCCIKITVWPRL